MPEEMVRKVKIASRKNTERPPPIRPTGTIKPYVGYRTLREFQMSKQSEHLRDQARRAARLALTISDNQASAKLKDMSRQFDVDAERLENSDAPVSENMHGGLQT